MMIGFGHFLIQKELLVLLKSLAGAISTACRGRLRRFQVSRVSHLVIVVFALSEALDCISLTSCQRQVLS